ncbi:MAG: acyl-CoA dehydrogenase family protein [Acidimicrobiia bacterium]|nr:acyl-CoA dehydrogenase family protein [Acidimicrobiia bacterium]
MTDGVLNQPPELGEVNLWLADPVAASTGVAGSTELLKIGAIAGSHDFWEWGFQANRNEPVLHSFDRAGHRADLVEFHPAWHQLLSTTVGLGITSIPYQVGASPGAHLDRALRAYLVGQVEQGHMCPVSMTYAVVPTLRKQPEVASEWESLLSSRTYDQTFGPPSAKRGVLMGMGMTERQGGSDVRANTTIAAAIGSGGPGGEYRLTGHKWFCSAPMNDAFLVLAQATGGLSCFFLPRWTPDEAQNPFHIHRLKDKLGNRSNASGEVEFEDTWARMIGDEGRGVATIIEMVNATRLDCVIGSAATMRQAVTQAVWHVGHRKAFGRNLVDQPLMQNVIADLDLEAQAATALMMRLATAFDRAAFDDHEARIKRILIPVAKYWVTKRCSEVVREAMECLGGGGYVEDSILPRLYRESPVNAIWEGSGNVIALDVMRVIAKEPQALEALLTEIETTGSSRLKGPVDALRRTVADTLEPESVGRRIVERLGILAAASALGQFGSDEVIDAYLTSRVNGDHGAMYGTLPGSIAVGAMTARAFRLIEAATA